MIHGLWPQAPLSMGFSRKNTGAGSHALLQGLFPAQGSSPGFPHCRRILYCLGFLPWKPKFTGLRKPLSDPRTNEGVRRSPSACAELQDLLGPVRQRVCAPQAAVSARTAQRHHSSPSLPWMMVLNSLKRKHVLKSGHFALALGPGSPSFIGE